ncbi:hypothetical protein GCM10009727_05160 [Actinomadura napierensis]|uniref:Transposase n=1 Tax=Actinomadura napierensis TaxID=267854 RepID=A0ABN2Y4J3_9ACTN
MHAALGDAYEGIEHGGNRRVRGIAAKPPAGLPSGLRQRAQDQHLARHGSRPPLRGAPGLCGQKTGLGNDKASRWIPR